MLTDALITLTGVSKRFGSTQVLDGIDLLVRRGEVVVLLGPSGAGKSTLCRTINGLEPIDAGTITVAGRPLPAEQKALAELRSEVAMIFQQFNLFAHKTALENVTVGPIRVRRTATDVATAAATRLLASVGMAEHADKYPRELSGGQQQRVAIARALAMSPAAILCDEPTSALDPETTKEVLEVLSDLADAGMTMLVVTHEMSFAKLAADRIYFLADGRVVEEGTPAEFFARPRTARAREFLGSLPDQP